MHPCLFQEKPERRSDCPDKNCLDRGAIDVDKGIVYLPLGNPAPDFKAGTQKPVHMGWFNSESM